MPLLLLGMRAVGLMRQLAGRWGPLLRHGAELPRARRDAGRAAQLLRPRRRPLRCVQLLGAVPPAASCAGCRPLRDPRRLCRCVPLVLTLLLHGGRLRYVNLLLLPLLLRGRGLRVGDLLLLLRGAAWLEQEGRFACHREHLRHGQEGIPQLYGGGAAAGRAQLANLLYVCVYGAGEGGGNLERELHGSGSTTDQAQLADLTCVCVCACVSPGERQEKEGDLNHG